MHLHLKRFFQIYKSSVFYILFLFILSLFSFWRELFFTFTKDDWGLFWGAYYNFQAFRAYWLHPATPVEVFLFAHVFGYHPFFWMLFGLVVRVCIAFAVSLVVKEFTKSKTVGFLAGIFYASTFASLESVGFISAHVASIAAFFVCLSLYFFILYIRGNLHAKFYFMLWYIIGFLSDPGRVFPTIIMFPLAYFILKRKVPLLLKKNWKVFLLVGSIIAVILGIVFVTELKGSLLARLFTKLSQDHLFLVKKFYLTGNYFAAIGNLLIGWIIPVAQDEQNTAVYNKVIARLGMGVVLFALSSFFFFIKTRKKAMGNLAFFSLWIALFYFPNWLFEPRAPMSGAHRYQTLSAVGMVGLFAYIISLVKKKWVLVALSAFFVVMNSIIANRILAFQSTFRNEAVFEKLWGQVIHSVPAQNKKYIFVFTGDQPLLSQSLGLGGIYLYALKKHITNPKDIPVVTNDPTTILHLLCYSIAQFSLENVYAWEVRYPAVLTSYSKKEREVLRMEAKTTGCSL